MWFYEERWSPMTRPTGANAKNLGMRDDLLLSSWPINLACTSLCRAEFCWNTRLRSSLKDTPCVIAPPGCIPTVRGTLERANLLGNSWQQLRNVLPCMSYSSTRFWIFSCVLFQTPIEQQRISNYSRHCTDLQKNEAWLDLQHVWMGAKTRHPQGVWSLTWDR